MKSKFITRYVCLGLLTMLYFHDTSAQDTVKIHLTTYYNGQITWENSPDNYTWDVIPGETDDSLQVIINQTTWFRAMISDGTCVPLYSEEVEAISGEPEVFTETISNITQTTAYGGGNIISQGISAVTARGICWNTNGNPTISDSMTVDGSGIGIFVSNLTGLSPNATYYVRAYATNSMGTAYGDDVIFTTLPQAFTCGSSTISDSDGNTYTTVQIGNQCWMKENLNVGFMINAPSPNQTNNSIIEKYCYNNDPANCTIYGGLYQWDEAMQYSTTPGTQGICPTGWHIPENSEWTIIANFLGGLSVAGGKMKEIGTLHWANPNIGATNQSGFTGIGAGYYDPVNSLWSNLTYQTRFWSSTEYTTTEPYGPRLSHYYESVVILNSYAKTYSYSIRCLKD